MRKLWGSFIVSLVGTCVLLWTINSLGTISNQSTETITALGNGSSTTFTIGFTFLDNDYIKVYRQDESAVPYTRTELVYGSGSSRFTISGGDPGTTVVMGTAPSASQRLIIQRATPITQPVDYRPNRSFPADDHEEQMDKAIMVLQELKRSLDDKIGYETTFTGTVYPFPSPTPDTFILHNHTNTGFTTSPADPAAGDVLRFSGNSWDLYDIDAALAGTTIDWGEITGTLSSQTDLQAALDAKQSTLGFTPEDVANKSTSTSLGTSDTLYPSQAAVKAYVDAATTSVQPLWGAITGTLSNQSDLEARLSTYQLTSEKGVANGYASLGASSTVPLAQLATGTANSSTFVRGDGTWAIPPTGGGGSTPSEYAAGNTGSTFTIDWTNGTQQACTLTDNVTFTLSNPTTAETYQIRATQDSTGSRYMYWPSTVTWDGDGIPSPLVGGEYYLIKLFWDSVKYSGSHHVYSWPFGLDGPLVITNGQTVTLTAPVTKDYSYVDIQAGGTLSITGNGWTIIGVAGSIDIDGTITGLVNTSYNEVESTTAPDGTALSRTVAAKTGGTGTAGGANSPPYGNLSGGAGGAQASGNGGGGGGGAMNDGANCAGFAGGAASTSNSGTGGGGGYTANYISCSGTPHSTTAAAAVYSNNGVQGEQGNSSTNAYASAGSSGGTRGRNGSPVYINTKGILTIGATGQILLGGATALAGGTGGAGRNGYTWDDGEGGSGQGCAGGPGGGGAGGQGGYWKVKYRLGYTNNGSITVAGGNAGAGGTAPGTLAPFCTAPGTGNAGQAGNNGTSETASY